MEFNSFAGIRSRNPYGWERAAKARLFKLKMEKQDKQLREEEASRGGQPLRDTAELERCSQPLGARLTGHPRKGNRCSRMTSVPQR